MLLSRTCFALLLASLSGLGLANERAEDFTYRAPLTTENTATWYQLTVPATVRFGARHADLRDLRVFNAEGVALPYAILSNNAPPPTQTRHEASVRLFPLYRNLSAPDNTPLDDQGLTIKRNKDGVLIEIQPAPHYPQAQQILCGWLLDASKLDFPLENIHLRLKQNNEGFQHFSIEASDDLRHWRDWGEGQTVHMEFSGERIDQSDIRLPGIKASYLRLLWIKPERAADLSEVKISGSVAGFEPPSLTWSASIPGVRVENTENDQYLWRLPRALPIERVRINIPQPNTLAPVVLAGRSFDPKSAADLPSSHRHGLAEKLLEGSAAHTRHPQPSASTGWQNLARGVLYRLPTSENRESVQDELSLPGISVNQLQLTIDRRGGGLGEDVPQLSLAVSDQQLVFLARGTPPFTLAWGNENVRSAALPLATLIPGYDLTLGLNNPLIGRAVLPAPEAITPAPPAPPPVKATHAETTPPPPPPERRIVLWLVLLGGVVLVFGMAISVLRSSK